MRLVIGGYGAMLGAVELGPAGFGKPSRAAAAEDPSWVVASADGSRVYAALERPNGALAAWSTRDDEDWVALGESPTGDAHPCHLALSPDGRFAVAANYTSGSVSVHALDTDGSFAGRTDLMAHSGALGPLASRQDGPHAHQVVFVDDVHLLVCDLGLDVVIGYRLEADGRLSEVARSPFAPGTGPRHLVLSPDGGAAYVLGELSCTVTVCAVNGLELEPGETLGTRGQPDRSDVENIAAAIVLDAAARRTLLVTNRGDDTIATVDLDGEDDSAVTVTGSGGYWPRFASLLPDGRLVVANERSDLVCLFERDGAGWQQRDAIVWPSPTCLASLP